MTDPTDQKLTPQLATFGALALVAELLLAVGLVSGAYAHLGAGAIAVALVLVLSWRFGMAPRAARRLPLVARVVVVAVLFAAAIALHATVAGHRGWVIALAVAAFVYLGTAHPLRDVGVRHR